MSDVSEIVLRPETFRILQPDLVKLTRALSTFPGPVTSATLHFFADGMQGPEWESDKAQAERNKEEYFALCKTRRVIPGAFYFETDSQSGVIVPDRSYDDGIERYGDQKWTSKAVALAMMHGRVREQRFKLRGNFPTFQEAILPSLIENNYQIGELDLGITWYYAKHGCYDDGGYEYSSVLRLSNALVLRFDDTYRVNDPLVPEQRDALKQWLGEIGDVRQEKS